MPTPATDVQALLNELLGAYWTALAQHQTHVAQLEGWGMRGLAASMTQRIADEPMTLRRLLDRLLDLGGHPGFELAKPTFSDSLRSILENEIAGQRKARPALNTAAELAADAHDATTRILLEGVLADEEAHLSWLETELELLDRVGEPLYISNRLTPDTSTRAAI